MPYRKRPPQEQQLPANNAAAQAADAQKQGAAPAPAPAPTPVPASVASTKRGGFGMGRGYAAAQQAAPQRVSPHKVRAMGRMLGRRDGE